ncbi:MAG: DUF2760 domain-containing protein, partial [bacterium]|nr:DUF2760 domain-containing protein [bacterium]
LLSQKNESTEVQENLEATNRSLQLKLSECSGRAESLLTESKRVSSELSAAKIELVELRNAVQVAEEKLSSLQQSAKEMGSDELYGTIINFLSRLQDKGRLLDFISTDISTRSDEEVGRVGRIVYQGAKEVISDCFAVAPLTDAAEKSEITLDGNYDKVSYTLSGNTEGEGPYSGRLLHRGWIAGKVNLPKVLKAVKLDDNFVITPAEVRIK